MTELSQNFRQNEPKLQTTVNNQYWVEVSPPDANIIQVSQKAVVQKQKEVPT
jgi:hypothetical protein